MVYFFVSTLSSIVKFFLLIFFLIIKRAGTRRAGRKSIAEIYAKGHHVAILTGGIAEMYLVSDSEEGIYLKSRLNAVKAAIEEGAHIVPTFFFGNSSILRAIGSNKSDSLLASLSRKIRASVVFCYGRWGLPIPFRHPLKLVIGPPVLVKQNSKPSLEEINKVLQEVIIATEKLYAEKKPSWEKRPLVIY